QVWQSRAALQPWTAGRILFARRRPPRPPLFPYTTLFRSNGSCSVPATTKPSNEHREAGAETAFIGQSSTNSTSRICGGRLIPRRSEEHTSELQSREKLVCRLLLEKKKRRERPQHYAAKLS